MHGILGHEGNYGIVTEAVIRLRPYPETFEFDSAVFPDFEHGIRFMEDVAKSRIWPASLRVFDNKQFQMAQAIKEEKLGIINDAKEWIKKFYLQTIKGFDLNNISACTIKYEGTKEEVERQKKSINEIVSKH